MQSKPHFSLWETYLQVATYLLWPVFSWPQQDKTLRKIWSFSITVLSTMCTEFFMIPILYTINCQTKFQTVWMPHSAFMNRYFFPLDQVSRDKILAKDYCNSFLRSYMNRTHQLPCLTLGTLMSKIRLHSDPPENMKRALQDQAKGLYSAVSYSSQWPSICLVWLQS